MKNVYGYIRVSTNKQGDGASLEAQKDAIERYAVQHDLNIVQWFEEKETAAKQGRPLFNAMIRLLKAKKASGLIVHKIDRGARNLKDWLELTNLSEIGIEIHFAHESLDIQQRGGRLAADIQLAVAADFIRNLRQEAIKGLYGRLNQGIYPFGAPIGYKNTGKGKHKSIDPVQGPLVKKAFELYATKKYTLHTLRDHMHKLGLRNARGGRMEVSSLSHMLNNQFYIGILSVKGQTFMSGHEPIITPALFKQVRAILRGSVNQRIRKHDFQFSKMLTCAACGYRLIAEKQKGKVYYRCHTKGCVTKGVLETSVETHLVKALSTAQLYPEEADTLEEIIKEDEELTAARQQQLLMTLRLRKSQLQHKLNRLTDTFIDGEIEKEMYAPRKEKLLMEIREAETSEQKIEHNGSLIYGKARRNIELAKSLVASYESGISEERKELIGIVTSNLSVEGKKLMIAMRKPFSQMAERWNWGLCAHQRNGSRKTGSVLEYSDVSTPPFIGKPLDKEKLRLLSEELLKSAALDNDTTEYDV